MECPKCGSQKVVASGAAMQTVRHVIVLGTVVHVVEDHWTCSACAGAFNVKAETPKVEPKSAPVKQ